MTQPSTQTADSGSALAVVCVLMAGVVAATNIGKLPPSLPVLREQFGLSLVQASFLVSMFQVGGMSIGIIGGMLADRFGLRRAMVGGLGLLAIASAGGALAQHAAAVLVLRGLESAGFILTVLPGPALLRRIVDPLRLSRVLGGWSCYMPGGMSAMMVATPWLLAGWGWRSAWWVCAGLALLALGLVLARVPADPPRVAGASSIAALARDTLSSRGPWLLALCFGLYAGQFITVFSFLPAIYQAGGIAPATAALLSAFGVATNLIGNLVAGQMIGRGVARQRLILFASAVMAVSGALALAADLPFALRYAGAVMLSTVGGMVPGTLFATAPRFAPNPGAVSTTTGLMQQGSALGQFITPPLVAAVASGAGGWTAGGMTLAALALANLGVALAIGRYELSLPADGPHPSPHPHRKG